MAQNLLDRRKKEKLWWWQDVVLMRRVFASYPDEATLIAWVPKHWATDVPLRMQIANHAPYGPKGRVVGIRLEGTETGWTDRHDPASWSPAVDSKPLKSGEIRFQVRVRSRGVTIWSGWRTGSIALVGPRATMMSPFAEPEAVEAMKRERPRLWQVEGTTRLLVDESRLLSFTSAVRCEVVRNGEVVGRVDYYQRNSDGKADHDRGEMFEVMFGEVWWLGTKPPDIDLDGAAWTLRFTSLPELAVLDYKSADEIAKMERKDGRMNRYWEGHFEVPLELHRP